METNTQTPPSTELAPVSHPEAPANIDVPANTEAIVPPSVEVVRYEAQQELEASGVAAAGYEIAVPTSAEVATRTPGEVVPLVDRLPAVREAIDTLASTQGEELALVEDHLNEQDVVTAPERDLKAEHGDEEPRHDTLLFLSGQEAEKPYAVKVGSETRIMKILELYKYLVTMRETVPSVSVVDAKGNVLMSANGEIAQAILSQTLIMQMAMQAVGLARVENPSGARVEVQSGAVTAQSEASPQATETPAKTSAPQTGNAPSAAHTGAAAASPDTSTEAVEGSSTEAPGTDMEMYDGETARANVGGSETEANAQPEQNAQQEAGPAAITSGEEGRLAAEAALQDLFPDGLPSDKEGQRAGAEKVKSRLAKEGIHPDRNEENAGAAYRVVNEKLNF